MAFVMFLESRFFTVKGGSSRVPIKPVGISD